MNTIEIVSINISEKKGTTKHKIERAIINQMGIEGDAHSGQWHRQISLLGVESIEKFEQITGKNFVHGDFAENLTTKGIILNETHPGDIFKNGKIELMVTQIGKKCHGDGCAIYKTSGSCIMPKEGIFVKVINGGEIKIGDTLEYQPKVHKIAVITLSDRAYNNIYEDLSGPEIIKMVKEYYNSENLPHKISYDLIPDDSERLTGLINNYSTNKYDLIITTGGTGIGPKDITPDIILKLADKEIPGIMDFIRLKYGSLKPNALISRSVAAVIDQSLVFALPGSVKAVKEYVSEITPHIKHLQMMLMGIDSH